eukprot:gene24474-biopygen11903
MSEPLQSVSVARRTPCSGDATDAAGPMPAPGAGFGPEGGFLAVPSSFRPVSPSALFRAVAVLAGCAAPALPCRRGFFCFSVHPPRPPCPGVAGTIAGGCCSGDDSRGGVSSIDQMYEEGSAASTPGAAVVAGRGSREPGSWWPCGRDSTGAGGAGVPQPYFD